MPLGKWASLPLSQNSGTPGQARESLPVGLTWIPAMLEMSPLKCVTIALLMAGLCPQ